MWNTSRLPLSLGTAGNRGSNPMVNWWFHLDSPVELVVKPHQFH